MSDLVALAGTVVVRTGYIKNGEPNVRQLEPDRCVAEAAGGAPMRGVKLILRRFRFRQTQEYENGAVERLYFFGGQ